MKSYSNRILSEDASLMSIINEKYDPNDIIMMCNIFYDTLHNAPKQYHNIEIDALNLADLYKAGEYSKCNDLLQSHIDNDGIMYATALYVYITRYSDVLFINSNNEFPAGSIISRQMLGISRYVRMFFGSYEDEELVYINF